MSELDYYSGSNLLTGREARRTGRVISHYRANSEIAVAAVDAGTDQTIAKIDSVTACVGHGAGAIFRVDRLQNQLETLAPSASGRLALLADVHALSVAELIDEHRRGIRRL